MKLARALALTSFAALTLVGCGSSPTTAKRVTKPQQLPTNRMQTAPGALQAPPAGTAVGTPQELQALLAKVRAAQTANQGFSATVETYDKGPGGTESDTIKVAYKKPSTLRLEMVKASGQAQGAKISWTGGSELKVKPTFLPFATTLDINDDKVKSKNGWTIKQTEVNAIFKVLFDPAAQITIKGQQAGDAGKTMIMLEARSTQSPKGITHEVIGIDTVSSLPGCRLIYRGQELAYRVMIKNMRLSVPSSSELEI